MAFRRQHEGDVSLLAELSDRQKTTPVEGFDVTNADRHLAAGKTVVEQQRTLLEGRREEHVALGVIGGRELTKRRVLAFLS